MSRVKMQVTLTFTADVVSGLSANSIMDRVDIDALGDGELVEVYSTEIESFSLVSAK